MNLTGKQYWRSLDELADSPSFRQWVEQEFPHLREGMLEPASRRTILKLMAASFGLAGLTACRRPVEHIMPFSRRPEGYVPGEPVYYATAMSLGGYATGVVVRTNDGRPTKIEGNPRHPYSLGATSAFHQASVLSLYDPDRLQKVLENGQASDWQAFEKFARSHFLRLSEQKGEGLWFLSETVNSPSLDRLRQALLEKFPQARWVEYEPINQDEVFKGTELAFGSRLQPEYRFDQADVIVALDADFLLLDAPAVTYIRQFASRRRVEQTGGQMNRLYVVEPNYTVTGANADHRLRLKGSEIRRFATNLAVELGLLPESEKIAGGSPQEERWIKVLARDLEAHRGRVVVLAGPRQPAVVHALCHWINASLEAIGKTVVFYEPVYRSAGRQLEDLAELAGAMQDGRVDTLVVLGGNPAFDAPADFDFPEALKRVKTVIHLSDHINETSELARWVLPRSHYLEAWGDVRAVDGTVSIQQPAIAPLYDSRSDLELLALLVEWPTLRAYEIVQGFWTAQWPQQEAERRWRKSLRDGLVEGTSFKAVTPGVRPAEIRAALAREPYSPAQGIEVGFFASANVYDGRFANNAWLQELPEPNTKLTWDNAALVSPATASRLGLNTGDLIRLEVGGRSITVPVFVKPGHADDAISVAVGYGRRRCGRVGSGVGHDVYPLRTSKGFHYLSGVSLSKIGRTYLLATTQEHHSMEGRPIILEASLAEYRENPHFVEKHIHYEPLEIYQNPYKFDTSPQWGMVIDLSACVGCNACITACQAENNIPVVGKKHVKIGREMLWLRVDRYYVGQPDEPQVAYQPVPCMQCENAPCETVCPVFATVHNPEGLNDMVYNRCIGTRYCSNNCPYKVRRFNFLNWHKNLTEVEKMVFNPEVTVRMRGVMEKCTYCIQRIQEARIRAKTEGHRPIRDGEVQTACQQACPADAIVFGDIRDPNSRVANLKQSPRNYALLPELNVRPRTTYLAKLRNPNPELV